MPPINRKRHRRQLAGLGPAQNFTIMKDMKKQTTAPAEQKDILVSFLSAIIDFCKQNKRGVLTALVILILAAVIGACYSSHVKKVTQNSWAAYYSAQVSLLGGNEQEGFFMIDELAKKYPGTPAAQYAQLLKADILYNGENYAQAADVYKPLVSSDNPTVATVAALSLAASHQALKEYQAAVDTLTQFIQNNPKSFALPQAYLTLAMSQELAGNKTEAINAYKQLADAYAQTYFGVMAKDKLAVLEK